MQWSGRGRLPLDLEQMLLNGTRLESLLITHTQEDEDKAKEAVKPAPTAAKGMFAYEDGAVKLHTWNGKKAMPQALQDLVKGGETLERFLTDANIAQAREIEHKLLKD